MMSAQIQMITVNESGGGGGDDGEDNGRGVFIVIIIPKITKIKESI